jgi:hypothetical protein
VRMDSIVTNLSTLLGDLKDVYPGSLFFFSKPSGSTVQFVMMNDHRLDINTSKICREIKNLATCEKGAKEADVICLAVTYDNPNECWQINFRSVAEAYGIGVKSSTQHWINTLKELSLIQPVNSEDVTERFIKGFMRAELRPRKFALFLKQLKIEMLNREGAAEPFNTQKCTLSTVSIDKLHTALCESNVCHCLCC